MPVGTVVRVDLAGIPARPVRATRSEDSTIPGVYERRQGRLIVAPGRDFGFVECEEKERVFVPPPLLGASGCKSGDLVGCMVVMAMDRKRGEPGWKTLVIGGVGGSR